MRITTRSWAALLLGCLAPLVLAQGGDVRERNQALIREQQAYHAGTLAYVWGYPMVDLRRQMHNKTHRVRDDQQILAPVNHFYRFEILATPSTSGDLRAPNNDTLYFGGWFDLTREPIVIEAPDTAGRYYTLAVTDFYSDVEHVGRRTTGTEKKLFALVGPDFTGTLPAGLHPVTLRTRQAWILGRMLVDGEPDVPAAVALMRGFRAAPLSRWQAGEWPAPPVPAPARPLEPMHSLAFFEELNQWLRGNPIDPEERALVALFDQAGFGPSVKLDVARLDADTRRGLERALKDGFALVQAATQRPLQDVRNGWIFPLGLGKYGRDYLLRASASLGGYANRPEESTYVARTVDAKGQLMSGVHRYHLHFTREQLPPAGAFWSIIAYDLKTFGLIENPNRRYSLGNRTPGLTFNKDGSLDVYIQREMPAEGKGNWLPVGEGDFYLVMRLYEPGPSVFDGSYRPPELLRRD